MRCSTRSSQRWFAAKNFSRASARNLARVHTVFASDAPKSCEDEAGGDDLDARQAPMSIFVKTASSRLRSKRLPVFF
jgi:hypothetical protein